MNLNICLLCFVTLLAFATTESNFFRKDVPYVKYDEGKKTWRMGNLRLEREVVFREGGIWTMSFRDKRSGQEFVGKPISEGHFVLSAPGGVPLMEGWKITEESPPEGWQRADFDDSHWRNLALPFRTDEENKTWWLRKRLPIEEGEKYILEFVNAIDDSASIYIDGVLVREVKVEEMPWTRTIALEVSGGKALAMELRGHGRPNGIYGLVRLTPLKDFWRIDLGKDFHLLGHKVTDTPWGKELVISLKGVNAMAGWEAAVHYGIYKGDEPWMDKWIELKGPRRNFQCREAVIDALAKKEPNASYEVRAFPGTSKAVWREGKGVVAGVGDILGSCESGGEWLVQLKWNYDGVVKEGRLTTPKAIIGVFTGEGQHGAFVYQLYMAHHYVRATPHSVPPLYNTWFGYYHGINQEICERIIPIAKEIGCEYFVIDDGWQRNNGEGIYGDWVVDEKKFPQRLSYIKELCTRNGLHFGIWFAPIMAHPNSQAVREHPQWLVKRGEEIAREWGSQYGFCMGSEWQGEITRKMLEYVKQGAEFFKCDDGLLEPGCTQPGHHHLPGASLAAQWEGWKMFCQRMREENPKFIIDRGWEGGPEVCNVNDEGWFGDWEIGYDPNRQRERRWWYKNADIYRITLWDLTFVRPSFTIAWETPCHLPIPEEDLNALEYHFTSIGDYICNVEVHGRLDEMTPREKEVIKRWVRWNKDNREYLAFTQPILERPWDPRNPNATPHIDGVMHLRPLYKGKYGYICLWNPGEEEGEVSIEFVPEDYLIKMDFKRLRIRSIKDGREIKWESDGRKLTLEVRMPPLTWEILEVGAKD